MAGSGEYKLGDYTIPRGWFMVAESAAVTQADQCPLLRRGRGAISRRERDGSHAGRLLRHMGTHPARREHSFTVTSGRHIDADSIRCPFHG